MKERAAALLGFIAAAAVPPLALCVVSPTMFGGKPDWRMTIGLLPILYVFSAMATVVFGIPAFLLGRYLGLVRGWSAAIAGFLVGIVADVALHLPMVVLGARSEWMPFALYGAMAGLVFWLVRYQLLTKPTTRV